VWHFLHPSCLILFTLHSTKTDYDYWNPGAACLLFRSSTSPSCPTLSSQMKYEVKFYVGGKIIKEEVYANSPKDARETGQARNPTAKIIGVNGTFR